ncbi:MAG TPA: type II toxin-antitoxin system VapC family toxin [Mucilaginibacter sp.]
MRIFLDTSSLIKLYFKEQGTSNLDKVLTDNIITKIFISELTKVEFRSAIYKKIRKNTLTRQNASDIIDAFAADEKNYTVILTSQDIITGAQNFIEKYGERGLRTLDAIQLSTAFSVKIQIDFAISDDKLLVNFFDSENIRTTTDN